MLTHCFKRQHIKLKQWLFVSYWMNKLCETQKILISVTFSFDPSAIKCPAIFAPDQGSLDCSHDHGEFSVGSTCRFSCNRGFELMGSTSVECTVSGSWSSPPPTCTGNDILTREANLGLSLHTDDSWLICVVSTYYTVSVVNTLVGFFKTF